MNRLVQSAVTLTKALWFRPGTVRKPWFGPYRSISFVISPQLRTRMVIFRGAYEVEVSDFLTCAVRPGMVLFDVGAHVGIHALHMAKLLKDSGKVYAFEAWPENFATLQRNVNMNPGLARHMVLIPQAVGSRCGRVQIAEGETDGMNHLVEEKSGVSVPMSTLDQLISRDRVCPALVLIDVEGAEVAVLEGAANMLTAYRPQIVIEWHGERRRAEVLSLLGSHGYEVRSLGPRHILAQHL